QDPAISWFLHDKFSAKTCSLGKVCAKSHDAFVRGSFRSGLDIVPEDAANEARPVTEDHPVPKDCAGGEAAALHSDVFAREKSWFYCSLQGLSRGGAVHAFAHTDSLEVSAVTAGQQLQRAIQVSLWCSELFPEPRVHIT